MWVTRVHLRLWSGVQVRNSQIMSELSRSIKISQFLLDSQAPIVSLNGRNPPKTSNSRYTITWDTNEQADFECTLNGRVVECGSGTRGEYTTSSLPDGEHTFEVNAVDNVGNRGTPSVVSWFTGTIKISSFINFLKVQTVR